MEDMTAGEEGLLCVCVMRHYVITGNLDQFIFDCSHSMGLCPFCLLVAGLSESTVSVGASRHVRSPPDDIFEVSDLTVIHFLKSKLTPHGYPLTLL